MNIVVTRYPLNRGREYYNSALKIRVALSLVLIVALLFVNASLLPIALLSLLLGHSVAMYAQFALVITTSEIPSDVNVEGLEKMGIEMIYRKNEEKE